MNLYVIEYIYMRASLFVYVDNLFYFNVIEFTDDMGY